MIGHTHAVHCLLLLLLILLILACTAQRLLLQSSNFCLLPVLPPSFFYFFLLLLRSTFAAIIELQLWEPRSGKPNVFNLQLKDRAAKAGRQL